MNKSIYIIFAIASLLIGLFFTLYIILNLWNVSLINSDEQELSPNYDLSGLTPPNDLSDYVPPSEPPPTNLSPEEEESFSTPDALRNDLRSIMLEIESLTALAAADTSACRLLPLGHSPCGGPAFYHVYVQAGSDENQLLALSMQHQALAQQLNQMSDIMGICMVTPEPEIMIENGNCVIQIN